MSVRHTSAQTLILRKTPLSLLCMHVDIHRDGMSGASHALLDLGAKLTIGVHFSVLRAVLYCAACWAVCNYNVFLNFF